MKNIQTILPFWALSPAVGIFYMDLILIMSVVISDNETTIESVFVRLCCRRTMCILVKFTDSADPCKFL